MPTKLTMNLPTTLPALPPLVQSLSQTRSQALSRRALLVTGLFGAALPACAGRSGPTTRPVGSLVGVELIDRETGQSIEVHHHRGRPYVAGRPGARYAIRVSNRTPGRLLVVTAVDGINILSGQTAAWGQTGYVFGPWQSHDLTGWRKSDQQVAAFEFTALPDSYAARTGRPLDVGAIGLAVFRERPAPVVQVPLPMAAERRADGRADGRAGGGESERVDRADATEGRAGPAAPAAAAAPSARAQSGIGNATTESGEMGRDSARDAARSSARESRERLGTGHGEREYAPVSRTSFERASTAPAEVVSLQYDRWENLVAAGIIPGERDERHAAPRPFPGSRENVGYVPDPPQR